MKTRLKKVIYLLICAVLLLVPSSSAQAITTVVTIDDTDGENLGIFNSLELNSSGFPVIAYMDYSDGDIKIAICSDVDCTTPPAIKILDDNTGPINIYGPVSMALTSNNYPRISYYAHDSHDLKVAACSNCISGNSVYTVDSVGDVGEGNAIALTAAGVPVISYYDATNKTLKVAVCGHYSCSTVSAITVVDSFSSVGGDTSIALNSSGYPVISYYDADNDDLNLAVCSNTTCTSKTTTIVDATGSVGYDSSIRLDSNGFPVIAYHDSTNSALKIAVCHDTTCTSKTITTVDNTESDGYQITLRLNAGGLPVISYFNNTISDVKLAACKDLNCTSKSIMTVTGGGDPALALDADGNAFISFRSSMTLKLAKVVKTDPALSINLAYVPYTGTPRTVSIIAYDNLSPVSGVVSNIRYNGSTTQPINPGTYAITADFTPDDILNFNSLSNVSVGDFVIQSEVTLNGGLNTYPTSTAKVPTNWKAIHFSVADGKNTTSKKEGTASVKISGNGTTKIFSQTRSLSGGTWDVYTFYYWVRGSSVPSSGICRGQVLFYNGNTLVKTITHPALDCGTGTYGYAQKSVLFAVDQPYTKVAIKFTYTKGSGAVWIDKVGLFK